MAAPGAQAGEVPPPAPQGILARVDTKYREVLSRPNLEDPLTSMPRINYPTKGCLIRPQYTVYAHYLHLSQMLEYNESLSIFMPQEPLLRSACISVFMERIKDKTIHPIYVETDKGWQHGQEARTSRYRTYGLVARSLGLYPSQRYWQRNLSSWRRERQRAEMVGAGVTRCHQ